MNLCHSLQNSEILQAENINNSFEINKSVLIATRENEFCYEDDLHLRCIFQNIFDRIEDILVFHDEKTDS